MRLLFATYSTALLIIAIVIHVGTYFNSMEPLDFDVMFLLQMGVIIAFGAFVISLNELTLRSNPPLATTFYGKFAQAQELGRRQFAQMKAATPKGILVVGTVVAIYCFVNFFVCGELLGDGQPHMGENGPYLDSHGNFVRFLSAEEYRRYSAYEARMSSGHLIIFSMFPAVYFWCVVPKLQPPERSTEA